MGTKFKLKDVTDKTWATLTHPPDGLITPLEASALCLRDVATCKRETADRITFKPSFARNKDWYPGPLPNIITPISWPFLKQPMFKKSSIYRDEILNLDFVAAPPAGYTVKIYSVSYSAGAQLPPQFIAVAYPMDVDIEKPPPFLVHFKHNPGQEDLKNNKPTRFFKYFDPLGFDWLFFDIWNWWVYNAALLPNGKYDVNMPFLSNQQYSFGFPYQLRHANKQYVVVLPQMSRTFDNKTGMMRDYQLYSAAILRDILIEIQKDILNIKDNQLSHVAISANSSGCTQGLSKFLIDNMALMKADRAIATFMNDELNELFVLDPSGGTGDLVINSMTGWLGLSSSRSNFKGKCVRFYTNSYAQSMKALAGTKSNPFKKGKYGFWESSAKTISLAYLPFDEKFGDDVWQRTCDEIVPNNRLAVNNHAFVHHVIPALCLTDAAARSLYV